MASADAEIYASLTRALGELGARWYVFGAQAAIVHGALRFTEDVDVTVDLGAHSHAALLAALERERFELRVGDERFVEQTRVLPLVHRPTRVPVDVVLAGPGIEQLFFEGVIELDIEGVTVPLARAEDVIVMKILSARAKDLEDVVAILAAQRSKLDEAHVRELLAMLESALDQSDLLPSFERCRERASAAR